MGDFDKAAPGDDFRSRATANWFNSTLPRIQMDEGGKKKPQVWREDHIYCKGSDNTQDVERFNAVGVMGTLPRIEDKENYTPLVNSAGIDECNFVIPQEQVSSKRLSLCIIDGYTRAFVTIIQGWHGYVTYSTQNQRLETTGVATKARLIVPGTAQHPALIHLSICPEGSTFIDVEVTACVLYSHTSFTGKFGTGFSTEWTVDGCDVPRLASDNGDGSYDITVQNSLKLTAVPDSIVRIQKKYDCGSSNETWELIHVAEKDQIARWARFTYPFTPSSGTYWEGATPHPHCSPTINCSMCDCLDNGDTGVAFYIPENHAYEVISTASALLGPPDSLTPVTEAAFDKYTCCLDVTKVPIKAFCKGDPVMSTTCLPMTDVTSITGMSTDCSTGSVEFHTSTTTVASCSAGSLPGSIPFDFCSMICCCDVIYSIPDVCIPPPPPICNCEDCKFFEGVLALTISNDDGGFSATSIEQVPSDPCAWIALFEGANCGQCDWTYTEVGGPQWVQDTFCHSGCTCETPPIVGTEVEGDPASTSCDSLFGISMTVRYLGNGVWNAQGDLGNFSGTLDCSGAELTDGSTGTGNIIADGIPCEQPPPCNECPDCDDREITVSDLAGEAAGLASYVQDDTKPVVSTGACSMEVPVVVEDPVGGGFTDATATVTWTLDAAQKGTWNVSLPGLPNGVDGSWSKDDEFCDSPSVACTTGCGDLDFGNMNPSASPCTPEPPAAFFASEAEQSTALPATFVAVQPRIASNSTIGSDFASDYPELFLGCGCKQNVVKMMNLWSLPVSDVQILQVAKVLAKKNAFDNAEAEKILREYMSTYNEN